MELLGVDFEGEVPFLDFFSSEEAAFAVLFKDGAIGKFESLLFSLFGRFFIFGVLLGSVCNRT